MEVFVGDLFDWRDLTSALHDVQLAHHYPPFDAQHLHGATMLALAAEQAGVEVVALMSGWKSPTEAWSFSPSSTTSTGSR